ncbi:putative membrane protein [Serratia marcescens]|nr:putative membrane protein [Serratia marcescens]
MDNRGWIAPVFYAFFSLIVIVLIIALKIIRVAQMHSRTLSKKIL